MTLGVLTLVLNILTALILPVALFLWRQIQWIRENDLKHLEENHRDLVGRLTRMEEKLDQHLDFSECLHRETENRLSKLESRLPPSA